MSNSDAETSQDARRRSYLTRSKVHNNPERTTEIDKGLQARKNTRAGTREGHDDIRATPGTSGTASTPNDHVRQDRTRTSPLDKFRHLWHSEKNRIRPRPIEDLLEGEGRFGDISGEGAWGDDQSRINVPIQDTPTRFDVKEFARSVARSNQLQLERDRSRRSSLPVPRPEIVTRNEPENQEEIPPRNIVPPQVEEQANIEPQIVNMANQRFVEGVKYKDASKSIREFDGQNLDVEDFIHSVERAAVWYQGEQIPAFIQHVKLTKLVGEAFDVTCGAIHNTVAEFIAALRARYKAADTVCELNGKLASSCQQPNESVCSYSLRIKELVRRIKENYKLENADYLNTLTQAAQTTHINQFNNQTEQSAIYFFIGGLRPDVKARVTAQRDFATTAELAERVEKDAIKYEKIRQTSTVAFTGVDSAKMNAIEDKLVALTRMITEQGKALEEKICALCKEKGHEMEKCPHNPFNSNAPRATKEAGSNGKKWCTHCKSNTHDTDYCWKLKNAKKGTKTPFCQTCRTKGHETTDCRKRSGKKKCYFCNSDEHNQRECQAYADSRAKYLKFMEEEQKKNGKVLP